MITHIEGNPHPVWLPIKPGATVYMGGLVCYDQSALDEGIINRPIAQGASNTTNKDRPLGIAIGHNLGPRINAFNSTYLTDAITDEGATGIRSSTTEYISVEGEWPKGGKRAMVKVALIQPGDLLRADIRNNAIGTAITLLTSTAGNANGLTVTTNATDVAGVANLGTIYCRTGLNAGQYRTTDDTSLTVAAWDVEMLNTTATAGETYVRVPIRVGTSYATFGATAASYIDASITAATDYDVIHVVRLNLERAGHEFADFYFDSDAFCTARA